MHREEAADSAHFNPFGFLFQDKRKTRGTIVAQEIFRGESVGEQVVRSGFKPDWRLVPRHEEAEFLNRECEPRPLNKVPSHCDFPPLFMHFLLKDMKRKGADTSVKPRLPLIIRTGPDNRALMDSESEDLEKHLDSAS